MASLPIPAAQLPAPVTHRIWGKRSAEQAGLPARAEGPHQMNYISIHYMANEDAQERMEYDAIVEDFIMGDDGEMLDPALVHEGKQKELQRFEEHSVFEPVPRQQVNPQLIMDGRWVNTKKSDTEVRCRWVLRHFNDGSGRGDFYANTPVLSGLRAQLAVTSAEICERREAEGEDYDKDPIVMVIFDVAVAFLHAELPPDEELYMEPPVEMNIPGEYVLRARRAIYGWRGAPATFQGHFAKIMETYCNMQRTSSDPCMFIRTEHPRHTPRSGVHVDDGQMTGRRSLVNEVLCILNLHLTMKVTARLEKPGDSGTILKRTIVLTMKGFIMISGRKYSMEILDALQMKDCNPSPVPGRHPTTSELEAALPLDASEAALFRSCTGKSIYIALDRPDVQCSVKELCRDMKQPTTVSMKNLKLLARYLRGRPEGILKYEITEPLDDLDMWINVDSDWAGDKKARKSTSAGGVTIFDSVLHSHSRTQATVALSSAEAEYNGMVSGFVEGKWLQMLVGEFGYNMKLRMGTDSSAAKAFASKRGAQGKMKHVDIKFNFLKEAVLSKDLTLVKLRGTDNWVDMMTKYLDEKTLNRCISQIDFFVNQECTSKKAKKEGAKEPENPLRYLNTVTITSGMAFINMMGMIPVSEGAAVVKLKTETNEGWMLMTIGVTHYDIYKTLVTMICVLSVLVWWLWRQLTLQKPMIERCNTRTVITQSQTTYLFWKPTPRFQPLAEHNHGAWSEQ